MLKLSRGGRSYRDLARLPRHAGHKKKCQHDRSLAKELSTMKVYRKGYRKMWEVAPDKMKAGKCLPPGSYDVHNHHGGVMYGWPEEMRLTDARVSKIVGVYAVQEANSVPAEMHKEESELRLGALGQEDQDGDKLALRVRFIRVDYPAWSPQTNQHSKRSNEDPHAEADKEGYPQGVDEGRDVLPEVVSVLHCLLGHASVRK